MAEPSGIWALGDYPRVARETIGVTGAQLVQACGIAAGQRVLDVAAGPGTVALPAARAGATVVASDITPELLEAGRLAAEDEGLRIEWIEADAQALPFADRAFDAVLSSFGAMFAPDHEATARELLRVCRPGGTIGMLNWTPESWVAQFFLTLLPFAPPPPEGAAPPILWGSEQHVTELFGDGLASLRTEREVVVVTHFAAPADLVAYYRAFFGPVVAAYAAVGDDAQRRAALDAALVDLAERTNTGAPGGPTRYELEYLLVVGERA